MLGNVREWCLDIGHKPDEDLPPDTDEASADRVIRGGSWANSARHVRAAYRDWRTPDYRYYTLGFRCRVR